MSKARKAKGSNEKAPKPPRPRLAVTVDGRALPDAEARAVWEAFSSHMDAHPGDMAGFAASRGWTAVAPTYSRGQAVLVVTARS